MDSVLKNEWIAESGSGCGMEPIITKVCENYVTLWHEPKSKFSGAGMAFAAFIILTVAAAACGLAAVL